MHTEVLQVAGKERGDEQSGLLKSFQDSSLISSPLLCQQEHTSFLKPALLAHPEPIHLRLSSAPLQNPLKCV